MLLQEVFLEDELFTVEEHQLLREILMDVGDGTVTNEQYFQEREEAYAVFSYELGIAYFYKYEEENNKKYAKNCFAAAAASERLEEPKQLRAQRLAVISDYYGKIGLVDAAGDYYVTYAEFWNDLTKACEGNLAAQDNERTALVMYGELLAQILSNTIRFREAGISREQIMEQLNHIEEHLKGDFEKLFEEEAEELLGYVRKARKLVESVYGQMEENRTKE